ncbi:Ferric reductase, NADH/NADPH oxidase and related proteins [Phaffia rhodozyma]|uniref:ferric-chelate reductase (NADPH) n=1 Tax=Phaffia rhodozyma TaxID=264483 RepID=A0A0F7SU77_PHARH|nr:Ferric reductase, NADH/NADPH oxidase and related proteins [Phaffia rhodozyma]
MTHSFARSGFIKHRQSSLHSKTGLSARSGLTVSEALAELLASNITALAASNASTSTTKSGSSSTTGTTTVYTNSEVMVVFLIVCAVIFGTFVVAAHPRILIRLFSGSKGGEIWAGWLIPKASQNAEAGTGTRTEVQVGKVGMIHGLSEVSLDEKAMSSSFPSDGSLDLKTVRPLDVGVRFGTVDTQSSYSSRTVPPVYFPSFLPTLLNLPLPRFIERLFSIDLTTGQLFVLVMYGLVVGLATFWFCDPRTDPSRSGVIATAQLPFVVALGCKNSIAVMLLGRSREKFNYVHRFMGKLIFIGSSIHTWVFGQKYIRQKAFEKKLHTELVLAGFIAWLGVALVTVSSFPIVRRRAFEFFQVCHWVGFMTTLIALYFHVDFCKPYCLSALGLYAIDLLYQFTLKKHLLPLQAVLTPLADGETTMVEIPRMKTGWRTGQYVTIRVIDSGMGFSKICQKHPFTIANAPSSVSGMDGDCLRLFIKSSGGWTKKLSALSRGGNTLDGPLGSRQVRVLIEGPYGGLGNTLTTSFSSVLLLAGGSGITFVLAQAAGLVARAASGGCRADRVDVVWIVRHDRTLESFLPYLTPLLRPTRARKTSEGIRLNIHIHVYVTGMKSLPTAHALSAVHPDLHVHQGRPPVLTLVQHKLEATLVRGAMSEKKGENEMEEKPRICGLVVGVCGPGGLIRDVREVVGGLNSDDVKRIGGVEVVTECF